MAPHISQNIRLMRYTSQKFSFIVDIIYNIASTYYRNKKYIERE